MKKIIFFLLLIPTIGFSQYGKIISNKTSGGTIIGDTLKFGSLNLKQTSSGQTISLGNYTSGPVTVDIANMGTVPVTMSPGGSLDTSARFTYRWTGSKWAVSAGSSGSGSGLDTSAIHKTGDEVIRSGIKTFVVSPSVPTPTLAADAANKGYVDTKAAAKQDTGTSLLRDGSRTATGTLNMALNNIKRVSALQDGSSISSVLVSGRRLEDQAGNDIATWNSQSQGFGILTNSYYGYLKTDRLTGTKTIQVPDSSGTIALREYLPSSLPPSGSAGGDLTGTYPNPTLASANLNKWKLLDTVYANSGRPGRLSLTDWNTFNNKASTTSVSAKQDTSLASGKIRIGQTYGGGLAVTPSGGFTISNAGVATLSNSEVIGKVLTGYTSGAGTVSSSDNILQAIQKLNGNIVNNTTSITTNTTNIATKNDTSLSVGTVLLGDANGRAKSEYVRRATSNARVNVGATLFSFGDSFTAGTGASTTAHNYVNVLNDNLGTTANNQGVGGRGWYQAIVNAYTNLRSTNIITPSTIMVGLNDWRRGGNNSKTYAKGQSCARAFFANHFLATAVAANDASVSTTGTWTTLSGIGDKASNSLSGLVRTSSVIGSTLTWSFSGESLVIGCFSTDQVNNFSGDFTVAVDGVSQGTYSGKNKTDGISDGNVVNSLVPNAFVLTNLGTGSHTVVVTTLETAATRIDYFGTLNNPQNCAPVIISTTPKMTALGYAKGASNTPPINLGTAAIFNKADSCIKTVANEFLNYPIYLFDVNKYWNPATDITTDTVHPSDLGHSHIANGFLSVVEYGKNYQLTNPIGLTDYSASNNMAWIGSSGDAITISVNRRPLTGVFYNTAKAAPLIQMTGTTSDSHINFFTTASNNTTPTQRMVIDKNGLCGFNRSTPLYQMDVYSIDGTGTQFRFGNTNTDAGGYLVSASDNQASICGGGSFLLGTGWKAKATSSSQVTMSTGAILFKCDTSTTIGNTFTPTERMRISPSGKVGINTTAPNSYFHVAGSASFGYVAKTGTYTATANDYLINCTANSFTVTLPTAVGIQGRIYEIVNSGAGTITIGTTSSQTFTNVTATPTTLSLGSAAGKSVRVMSDGANWMQLH